MGSCVSGLHWMLCRGCMRRLYAGSMLFGGLMCVHVCEWLCARSFWDVRESKKRRSPPTQNDGACCWCDGMVCLSRHSPSNPSFALAHSHSNPRASPTPPTHSSSSHTRSSDASAKDSSSKHSGAKATSHTRSSDASAKDNSSNDSGAKATRSTIQC